MYHGIHCSWKSIEILPPVLYILIFQQRLHTLMVVAHKIIIPIPYFAERPFQQQEWVNILLETEQTTHYEVLL